MEEGWARVVQSRYIGCQRVDDPEHPAGPWRYYQTLLGSGRAPALDRQHEIDERRLVRPEDFLRTLSWGSAPSAAIILEEGLNVEAGRGPCRHGSFAAARPAADPAPPLVAGQSERAALEDLGQTPGCSGQGSLVPGP